MSFKDCIKMEYRISQGFMVGWKGVVSDMWVHGHLSCVVMSGGSQSVLRDATSG